MILDSVGIPLDKPVINNYDINVPPKRGEVYIVHFDGIGSEQTGKRPAVILQNNMGNQHSPTVLVAPLTTQFAKKPLPTHVFLPRHTSNLRADSIALMEQVRVVDKSRLLQKIATLQQDDIERINRSLLISFGLDGK